MGESQHMINRRTVAKGIAWSVPVVAVAGAAPAFAVSGSRPRILGGQAFKLSGNSCSGKTGNATGGNKAYLFTFRVTNTDDLPIYLYGATITTSISSIPFTVVDADPNWGTAIAPGATVDVTIWGNGADSGNTNFTATAQVFWGHVAPPAGLTLPIPNNSTNPDVDPVLLTPTHPPVQVGPWNICGTPTLPSQDLEKCQNPGYIPVPATCPQPAAAGNAEVNNLESTELEESVVEDSPEPLGESTPEGIEEPAVSETTPVEAPEAVSETETTVVESTQ